ncbi:MAG: hypothetical protein WAZ27_01630 [Minisyncoccia bacterium]
MQNFWELSRGARILLFLCSLVVLAEGAFLYSLQTKETPSTCEYVVAEWEQTKPAEASAKDMYVGPIAPVNFEGTFPEAKEFEAVIAGAVSRGPNFAGHFTIAEWSCGTNCQDHSIVDVITGNIVAYGIPSEAGLSFDTGSALIMTNPPTNFPGVQDLEKLSFDDRANWFNMPREYYALSEANGSVTLSRLCIENAFEGKVR